MKVKSFLVAQPHYKSSDWADLPIAGRAAQELAEELSSVGYEIKYPHLLEGGEKEHIESLLDYWISNEVKLGSHLTFAWSGHGYTSDNRHYLICRSSPRSTISALNAIDAAVIGSALAKCPADKILILLDTCYSGHGATSVANTISDILSNQAPIQAHQRAFAIIASSHPLETASEGIFFGALRQVLLAQNIFPDIREWTDNDEYIHSDALCKALERLTPSGHSLPQYRAIGSGQKFIGNPRYKPSPVAEIVEERIWRLSRFESEKHFVTASRGAEVGTPGWFFAGRRKLLWSLVNWLSASKSGIRVVTGPPGAGKSAVLGRLVTLSDEEYRQQLLDSGSISISDEALPEIGVFDVILHAKGKTLDECSRGIAEYLGISFGRETIVDVERLIPAVGKLDRLITILIDALDEAATGHGLAIASHLVAKLGRLQNVRVLVGTRRTLDGSVLPRGVGYKERLHAVFGDLCTIDDLEDEIDTEADITQYAQSLLSASEKFAQHTSEQLHSIACKIAAKADGVFLYARIVSRTLQEIGDFERELPDSALDAFEQDISTRFRDNQKRVEELLAALAFAEGKGLSRRIWPIVANALSHAEHYEDRDIAWLLRNAGWHVIEAGESGETVYRLAHQALADFYVRRPDAKIAHSNITRALIASGRSTGWANCEGYIIRHLSDHAAAAEELDGLLADAGFLAAAEPSRLLAVLPSVKSTRGRRFVDVYDRVVDRLVGLRPVDRLPLIHMTAQMQEPSLASLLEPPGWSRWKCRWARHRPSTPHRLICRHAGPVTAIDLAKFGEASVGISTGMDWFVRVWDARTGEPLAPSLKVNSNIRCAAIAETMKGLAIVLGGDDGDLYCWDTHTGTLLSQSERGHAGSVTAVIYDRANTTFVSGGADGRILRSEAVSGAPVGRAIDAHKSWISSLKIFNSNGNRFIVSACGDGIIRRWSASTGEAAGAPLLGHKGEIVSISFEQFRNQNILVSGGVDGTVRMWDLDKGRSLGKVVQHGYAVSAVATGVWGSSILAVSAGEGIIRCWDMLSGEQIAQPLVGHRSHILSISVQIFDGIPVVFSGGYDGVVRRFEIHPGRELLHRTYNRQADKIESLAVNSTRTAIISCSLAGEVRSWNPNTGDPIGQLPARSGLWGTRVFPKRNSESCVLLSSSGEIFEWDGSFNATQPKLIGSTRFVQAAALVSFLDDPLLIWCDFRSRSSLRVYDVKAGGEIGNPISVPGRTCALTVGLLGKQPVVFAGDDGGVVHCWDIYTRTPIGEPILAHRGAVTALQFGLSKGGPRIASSGEDYRLSVWDPLTGSRIGFPLLGAASSLTFAEVDENSIFFAGLSDGKIIQCDADTGGSLGLLIGRKGSSSEVVSTVIDHTPIIVSGSSVGGVRRWDVRSRTIVGEPSESHSGRVTSVVFASYDGTSSLLTAGQDGDVCIWHADTGTLIRRFRGIEALYSLAWGNVDGSAIAYSGTLSGSIRRYDLENGVAETTWREAEGSAAISLMYRTIGRVPTLIVHQRARILLMDARTGKIRGVLRCSAQIGAIACETIDGREVIFAGGLDGCVYRWDADTGRSLGKPKRISKGAIRSLSTRRVAGHWFGFCLDRNGRLSSFSASGKADGVSYDAGNMALPMSTAIARVDHENVIASAFDDGIVRLMDVSLSRTVLEMNVGSSVWDIKYKDGLGIAVACDEGVMLIDC